MHEHALYMAKYGNSEGSGPILLKIEVDWDFMPVLDTCKFDEDRTKSKGARVETLFSPLQVNRSFLFPWRSFDWICRKTWSCCSPTL